MKSDQITWLAMRDAETETDENLRAAANLYDRLRRNHTQGLMVQDDIMGTPLPNGLLQWFGFDFERVDLPDTPLLKHGENPIWVGTPPGFTMKTGAADARIEIRAEEFEPDPEYEGSAAPRQYTVTVRAHGLDRDEEVTCKDWHEVQQRCRILEQRLDESHADRHAACGDQDGNLSEDACAFCERGQKGG